jgi:hypothetical protein
MVDQPKTQSQQKVEVKKLEQQYSSFRKIREEYKNASAAYHACQDKMCAAEREAFHKASLSDTRVLRAKYVACFKEKCSQEYARFVRAHKRIHTLVSMLVFGLYTAVVVGTLAVTGGIIAAEQIKINNLIKKYELEDEPNAQTILYGFLVQGTLVQGSTISDALRDALAEIKYGATPTQEKINQFDDLLGAHSVVIQPRLR